MTRPQRGNSNAVSLLAEPITSEPVRGRDVKLCPPDRLPGEGETIFSKVTVRSISDYCIDPDTDCWNWNKATLRGYPISGNIKPHRLYYARANGPIPPDHDVHHVCHNTRCINPDHLEALHKCKHRGDHLRERKRFLTWDQAREIRRLGQTDASLSYPQIAEMFGCSRGLVQDIVECIAFVEPGIEWRKPERPCKNCGDTIPQERKRNAQFCTNDCRIKFYGGRSG